MLLIHDPGSSFILFDFASRLVLLGRLEFPRCNLAHDRSQAEGHSFEHALAFGMCNWKDCAETSKYCTVIHTDMYIYIHVYIDYEQGFQHLGLAFFGLQR